MPAPERLALGIDIGGTHTRAALVSLQGKVVARRRVPSRRHAEAMLADCVALVEALRTDGVEGLGVGVPGQVDAATGEVFSGGYVDLSSIPFAGRLSEATGLTVGIENDGAMALLGEHAFGTAQGSENAVFLGIGTGIGGAMIERGQLVRGRRSAGQLGHLVVEPDGLRCLCGKRGCVETTSSGTALGRLIPEAGLPEGIQAADLLARSGEEAVRRVLVAWAAPLRRAVDSLVATLDPDVVVLGGGLGAEAVAALDLLPPPGPGWFGAPVRASQLGDDAGVIGAAVAAFRHRRRSKRVVLVNGVPASGKSTVARTVADALGWPLVALDTVKQPFLEELPPGDRLWNRKLGRASYRAILDLVREAPEGAGFVLDAWFGFQPIGMLRDGLAAAGIGALAELWCEAPPEEIGKRYGERVGRRGPGHPGADYVPELRALAARAMPTGLATVRRIDTTRPFDRSELLGWIQAALAESQRLQGT